MGNERRTVLITGATGKLGRVFALGFSGLGYSVAFTSRGGETARGLENDCRAQGARLAACIEVDLTVANAPAIVVEALKARELLPDVLINNARNAQYLTPDAHGQTTRSDFQGELLLDVVLPYELVMALADVAGSPLKTVVNIASMYGIVAPNLALYESPGRDSAINYGVGKAALIHLTKELAVRLAARRISVNAVSYGGVVGRTGEDFRKRYARLCPAGKMLDDSEVFGAVKFLASTDADGMTGHNLVVDGGWTTW